MVKSKYRRKLRRFSKGKTPFLVAALLLILLFAGVGFYYHSHHKTVSKSQPPTVTTKTTASSPSKTQPTTSKGTNETSPTPTSPQPTPTVTPTTNDTNVILQKPSGYFASNHFPGQNGSGQDETSVCNTTAGASCYISFTKAGITKSLPAATTDDTGAAYWSWTPQTVGLTSGSWIVNATATLGQQSASTQDSTQLEIQ